MKDIAPHVWQQSDIKMNEIIFLVEDSPEGGFIARALDASIYTDADNLDDLHGKVRGAVDCHFEPADKPKIIRLHFVHEEIIAAWSYPREFRLGIGD